MCFDIEHNYKTLLIEHSDSISSYRMLDELMVTHETITTAQADKLKVISNLHTFTMHY